MIPLLQYSPMTKRYYIVTHYKLVSAGKIQARRKYDITEQVQKMFPIAPQLQKTTELCETCNYPRLRPDQLGD